MFPQEERKFELAPPKKSAEEAAGGEVERWRRKVEGGEESWRRTAGRDEESWKKEGGDDSWKRRQVENTRKAGK